MPDPTQPTPPHAEATPHAEHPDELDRAFLHTLETTDWRDNACHERWLLLTPDERTASREALLLVFLAQLGSTEGLARMLLGELRDGPPGALATYSFLTAEQQALVSCPETPQADAEDLFLQRMMPLVQAKLVAYEQRTGGPFHFGA